MGGFKISVLRAGKSVKTKLLIQTIVQLLFEDFVSSAAQGDC